MSELKYIEVERIYPHPDNPRKELGDLTELADSIKANGIYQNLTVVPWFSDITGAPCEDPDTQEEMGYRVVIGHRRLAAAKMAGLERVPCIVSEMDRREQIQTMLLENMQRSDLTVWEQAQGFQMMMDLGESIEDIANKSGFSQSTVRRRVKLLELDPEKFKATQRRGATLMDYAELEKIKNIDYRNQVLDYIGTPNFRNELSRALQKEEQDELFGKWIEKCQTFAERIEDRDENMDYVTSYYSYMKNEEIKIPEDAGEVKYFYKVSPMNSYNPSITIYKEKNEEEELLESEESRKARELLEKSRALDIEFEEIAKRHEKLRKEYVFGLTNANQYAEQITAFAVHALIMGSYFDEDDVAEEIISSEGLTVSDDNRDENLLMIDNIAQKSPVKTLLKAAYMIYIDNCGIRYHQSQWSYEKRISEKFPRKDEKLKSLYAFLESIGYEISDEEKAMLDSTHELYIKAKAL